MWNGLDATVLSKELAALVQGHRVRKRPAYLAQPRSRDRYQFVRNPHAGFGPTRNLILKEVVVILMNAAVQCVFNGDDGVRSRSRLHRAKHFTKGRARQRRHASAHEFVRGFKAKCTSFTLKCDGKSVFSDHLHLYLRGVPDKGRSSTCGTGWQ